MKTLFKVLFWLSVVTLIAAYAYTHAYADAPELKLAKYAGWCVLGVTGLCIYHFPNSKWKQPRRGSFVEITWLEPCRNSTRSKNPYIGMRGEVTDVFENGGFAINTGSSVLVVTGNGECQYKYVTEFMTIREFLSTTRFEEWFFRTYGGGWDKARKVELLDDEAFARYFKNMGVTEKTLNASSVKQEVARFKKDVDAYFRVFNANMVKTT